MNKHQYWAAARLADLNAQIAAARGDLPRAEDWERMAAYYRRRSLSAPDLE